MYTRKGMIKFGAVLASVGAAIMLGGLISSSVMESSASKNIDELKQRNGYQAQNIQYQYDRKTSLDL